MSRSHPKAAVFAYSEVGYVCLEELISRGANLAVVFTHEDDRDENIWFRSVRELAKANGVPVRTDANLGEETFQLIKELGVELIFSFYYRAMIPIEIISFPRLGAYNVHGSLLPKYRGRACVNWAVINGETETGATLHKMEELADRGDIIDQESVPILHEDTALDVFLKVAEAGRKVVARSFDSIENGTAKGAPLDESGATKFGRRRPEDGLIDWSKSADEIYNLIRGLTHPFPGAFAMIGEKKFFIWRARVIDGHAEAGAMISDNPPVFGTGNGLIEALSFQFEGDIERSF